MLTRAHRLVNPLDFKRVVRRGARFSGKYVIAYFASPGERSPRAGFIVAKNVGVAVTRNLVKRRLRAAIADLWALIDSDLVVRALPAAATATYAELVRELSRSIPEAQTRRVKSTPDGQGT